MIPKVGPEEVEEEITAKDWVLRRAMGKRVGNFRGEEHWDRMQGTEAYSKKYGKDINLTASPAVPVA